MSAGSNTVTDEMLLAVSEGRHSDPHSILGRHPDTKKTSIIRVRRPLATTVEAVQADGTTIALEHLNHGIWAGIDKRSDGPYQVRTQYDTTSWIAEDPYRFAPTIGSLDLHLIGEGRHEELWRVLGSHTRTISASSKDPNPISGVAFTVWAPHAKAVRVIGEFNEWDGVAHAMRSMGSTGVWELFIPGLADGVIYKFEILTADGLWVQRADPMARSAEIAPATASVVSTSAHIWSDSEWLKRRASTDPHNQPMSVYEIHLGSWRAGITYRSVADELIEYLGWLGYTHVEFMPLAEHPFGGSWGYQVTGYYAISNRFGSPDDLRYLIDRLHQAGFGVIMDWVPGHFPKDEWALARFDGQPLYEHPDPRRGEQKDWGTLVFNFGDPQVRNFLVANALFWLEEMHIDGLRVDAVASMIYLDYSREDGEWLPNEFGGREHLEAVAFLQETTATAYKRNPGIVMIAEESTSWPGVTSPTSSDGLGFGFKWNMGWMHDTLQYIGRDPMYRSHHHGELTLSFSYAFSENFVLPISHDEVVHGKGSLLSRMPGSSREQFANLRAYLGFMWAHPGKKLLFMGQEFAQREEWSETRSLDWWLLDVPAHRKIAELITHLNGRYRGTSALWELDNEPRGFSWVEGGAVNESLIAFLRFDCSGNPLLSVTNFSGISHRDFMLGVPRPGLWQEILNTDGVEFDGTGEGNLGTVTATDTPWGDFPASVHVTVPALSTIWFVPATT